MQNSDHKHSRRLLSHAFGVAKKLSDAGLDFIRQNSSDHFLASAASVIQIPAVPGSTQVKTGFEARHYENPEDMLRKQLPWMTQQLFGRHVNTVNKLTHWISPQLTAKISDYCFTQLNQFSNSLGAIEGVLDQAGVKELEELTRDPARSRRLSEALAEQNKWIASIQGVLTGATGIMGSSIDIPACLILSLRTIYQIGRAYGYDLNDAEGQEAVHYIFNHVDLAALAEKHTLLLGLRTVTDMLQIHDIQQLQQLLGSDNDIDLLNRWLSNADGEMKWSWLNHLDLSVLTTLSPVIGASIGAAYGWKFIVDVKDKAQEIFALARQYQLLHPESSLSVLSAYQHGVALAISGPVIGHEITHHLPASEKMLFCADPETGQQSKLESIPSDQQLSSERSALYSGLKPESHD